ncbi:histidine kinase [Solwaraspora sp. WMMD1047]|uniref:sensor histidine kinase n=1 Tax=Solwaraspora sp. WMMD1047 TaxID=3016102 RepID=UPI002415FADA|nr:histidine kinase [Solwaraspora sp. WMMD1047]MDG4832464.1 histidine kinase [Solwaraspora sp. WMMD1047]
MTGSAAVLTRLGLDRGSLRRDLAIATGYLVGGLVLYSMGFHRQITAAPDHLPERLLLVTLGVGCVAVALRRVATRTGLALGTAATLADLLFGGSLGTLLVYSQVLYDSCVFGSRRMWRGLLVVTVALTPAAALLGVLVFWSWQGAQFGVLVALIGVLPVVTGISVRQYRDQAAAERLRAEQTARLAELDQRQAVAAERTRMARELHDVIANHLSAVAIHATAALSVASLDREQVNQALRVIRENSVQGLAEMRQMIGLLREPAEPDSTDKAGAGDRGGAATAGAAGGAGATGPPAGDGPIRFRLVEVDRLVEKARGTGLALRLETLGRVRPLPVSVDLAAYRIVQESLTNAVKHGAGRATLTIDYRPDLVRLVVENPLPDATAVPGAESLPGARVGLIGMRERAVLLRGRFEAGPLDGHWRVHAELPTVEEKP